MSELVILAILVAVAEFPLQEPELPLILPVRSPVIPCEAIIGPLKLIFLPLVPISNTPSVSMVNRLG